MSKTLYVSACSKNSSQSVWNLQQQQRQQQQGRHLGEHRDTCSGAKPRKPQQLQQRSTGRLVAEEENSFQVELRIQGGVPQEVVDKLQYLKIRKSRMSVRTVKKWLTCSVCLKLRTGYQTESIMKDLVKKGKSKRRQVMVLDAKRGQSEHSYTLKHWL